MKQAKEDGAVVVATSRLVGYEDAPVDCTMDEMDKMAAGDLANGEFEPGAALAAIAEGKSRRRMWKRDPATIWAELRYLMPFDNKRIAAFISNWYLQRSGSEQEAAQKAGDLQAALKKSDSMQELARTPNLLSLMAIVHRERAHLPEGKALLYKEISNAYINTIDQQRKININDAFLPYGWEAREAWLAYVGFKMQCERYAAQYSENQEAGVLVDEAKVLAWLGEAMQASGVPAPERNAAEFLSWLARRSGLLLPRGEGVYAFVHLSFQEYFCACYLLRRVTSRAFIRDTLPADAPVTKALLARWGDENLWRESLVYLLELMSSAGDSEAVEEMLEILFGGIEQKNDFDLNQAGLAALILQDRHIYTTTEWKQCLAWGCSRLAIAFESIFKAMVQTACAAIIDANATSANEWVLPNFAAVTKPDAIFAMQVNDAVLPKRAELARFQYVRSLRLNNPKLQDISALAGLKSLQWLDLGWTQVQDISALAGLSKLRWLDLQGTQVQDISALAGLGNLRSLLLLKTQKINTTALQAALPKLEIFVH